MGLNLDMHLLLRHTGDKKKTWDEVATEQTTNHVANFKERIYNGHGFKIISKGSGTLKQHPYAALTHDQKEGWGPDELTLKRIIPGDYTLYVQRIGEQTTSLQESDAKISVYQNGELVDVIVAPTNGQSMTKDFWNVLEFQGQDSTSPMYATAFD